MADGINVKEFKYDDSYYNEEYDSVTLYFTGPKKYLPEKYQDEAESMEISIEYLGNDMDNVTVMFSPTANFCDYDWYDGELSESDVDYLFKMTFHT